MPEITIRASELTKVYQRLDSPFSRLQHAFWPRSRSDATVALHPTSFTVARGESVGIVGRNGSGKSTLLSMIAGVTAPTAGTIEVAGRVAALLELGSGFNPDFTGRENVFFNGQLHGLSSETIASRFRAIETFADIGAYIDRPVKTYSSGMFVRLAFAVAIHLDPEVLIIDEALSVGDVYFQQKCFERLRHLRAAGTTMLFVSHDSSAIIRFCDRALLLDSGRILADGAPRNVIERYEEQLIAIRDAEFVRIEDGHRANQRAGSSLVSEAPHRERHEPSVSLISVRLLGLDGNPKNVFTSGEEVCLEIRLQFINEFEDPHVGFKVRNRFGDVIFETNSYCMRQSIGSVSRGEELVASFTMPLPLAEGSYTLHLGVADGGYGEGLFARQLIYQHDVLEFSILRNVEDIMWSGVVNLGPRFGISKANHGDQASPNGVTPASVNGGIR
jgi:lipopolysaccharide transport system ATP-binding protein